MFQAYCNEKGLRLQGLKFLYDGLRLNNDETPAKRGLEDGDEIDVVVWMEGGGGIEREQVMADKRWLHVAICKEEAFEKSWCLKIDVTQDINSIFEEACRMCLVPDQHNLLLESCSLIASGKVYKFRTVAPTCMRFLQFMII